MGGEMGDSLMFPIWEPPHLEGKNRAVQAVPLSPPSFSPLSPYEKHRTRAGGRI